MPPGSPCTTRATHERTYNTYMGDDRPVKSSYELAMERLKQKDKDAGVEATPLTESQKAAITEIRNFYTAKLAEADVLHQGRLRSTVDPAERAEREQEYRRDRERLTTERDAKIEKARRG
jgi:hypothetical protein